MGIVGQIDIVPLVIRSSSSAMVIDLGILDGFSNDITDDFQHII